MLNFGASKPRVKGGPPAPPPWIRTCSGCVEGLGLTAEMPAPLSLSSTDFSHCKILLRSPLTRPFTRETTERTLEYSGSSSVIIRDRMIIGSSPSATPTEQRARRLCMIFEQLSHFLSSLSMRHFSSNSQTHRQTNGHRDKPKTRKIFCVYLILRWNSCRWFSLCLLA